MDFCRKLKIGSRHRAQLRVDDWRSLAPLPVDPRSGSNEDYAKFFGFPLTESEPCIVNHREDVHSYVCLFVICPKAKQINPVGLSMKSCPTSPACAVG